MEMVPKPSVEGVKRKRGSQI